jgi:divalent metal cation (Fe/Co/Zn/Cd) transporter
MSSCLHPPYLSLSLGAVLISLVIIYRWVDIISEQVKKIVGHTAPPEYIEKVRFCALACVGV